MKNDETKKSKLIASILNIVAIGAGYLYIGHWKKSLIFYPLLSISLITCYYISTITDIGYLPILMYVILFCIYLYTIIDAFQIINRDKTGNNNYSTWHSISAFIIIIYSSTYLIKEYSPLKLYNNPSKSMENTIMLNDQIVVNRLQKDIQRGDLIVFKNPEGNNELFVKRCVALEGDELYIENRDLFIHFKEGDKYIAENFSGFTLVTHQDKLWVKNPYSQKYPGIHHDNSVTNENIPEAIFNFPALIVKKEHYFVLGDNRDHAYDSRFIGAISSKNIEGKVGSFFINEEHLDRASISLYGK